MKVYFLVLRVFNVVLLILLNLVVCDLLGLIIIGCFLIFRVLVLGVLLVNFIFMLVFWFMSVLLYDYGE